MPLRQANSELSEKSGMLQVEKKLLEEEIKRWKARTQVCSELHVYISHYFSFSAGKGLKNEVQQYDL